MKDIKREYKSPCLSISISNFEDILLVSIVEGGNDIFDFDEEL